VCEHRRMRGTATSWGQSGTRADGCWLTSGHARGGWSGRPDSNWGPLAPKASAFDFRRSHRPSRIRLVHLLRRPCLRPALASSVRRVSRSNRTGSGLAAELQHRKPAPAGPHPTTSTEAAKPRHLVSPVRMLPASREVPVAITKASGSLSACVRGRIRPARRAQPRAEVLERPGRGLRKERLGAGREVQDGIHLTG
jgi:hypothetical protein